MKINFKKYLPFESYILTSKLSVEEVKKRLAENIEPKQYFRFPAFIKKPSSKPYEGEILVDTFIISRIINYGNSFLPLITGRISTFVGKTQINIKMRPMIFVLIFISLWLGIVGLFCLGIVLTALFQIRQILENGFSPIILIPFGMFLFGYLLTTLGFKAESKNSKEFLARLLDGDESI